MLSFVIADAEIVFQKIGDETRKEKVFQIEASIKYRFFPFKLVKIRVLSAEILKMQLKLKTT